MTELSLTTDLSGAAYKQFVKVVTDAWSHNPATKEEALALYKYVMKSQIEPAINLLLDACLVGLPAPEAAVAKAAINAGEVALAKCGCW